VDKYLLFKVTNVEVSLSALRYASGFRGICNTGYISNTWRLKKGAVEAGG
jgi:hypothetical protein